MKVSAFVGSLALVAGVITLGGATESSCVTPPEQPASGFGSNGPCGEETTSFDNPIDAGEPVHVFVPTGAGSPALTGGRCDDDRRPVVFFSHGLGAGSPSQYADLVTHLVSHGSIVVFATYAQASADLSDPSEAYEIMDAGHVAAVATLDRADLTRVGFMGHSMGGGMAPFLLRQGFARGWGSRSLFLMTMAMFFPFQIGQAPIELPSHTRVIIQGFDEDFEVDNRIGIQLYEAIALPDSHKQHVTVISETRGTQDLHATHFSPQTTLHPNDAIRTYGIFRNVDVLQSCALHAFACDTDLSFMGEWSDGEPVAPALSTDDPVDVGYGAVIGCESDINPLGPEGCPPSS